MAKVLYDGMLRRENMSAVIATLNAEVGEM
jgi:hypothetical protein